MMTTGSFHDSPPYLEPCKYQQDRAKMVFQEVVVDKAYGSGGILESLEQQSIKTDIPLFNSRNGSSKCDAEGFLHYHSAEDNYISQTVQSFTLTQRKIRIEPSIAQKQPIANVFERSEGLPVADYRERFGQS